ncbi:sulfatase family protein [Coraliomargarita parva]|uniref:sulfatase family protein n=1 Tax=Coraliomargarita parva TaxID=3014050 RepID=UPI0022B42B64|nr:sulfatase-like hydrolase/transferase [Coraliomargarita parva]
MSERPNILLIYTDQQRWDALGANDNPEIHTPNLDRLAKQSVSFDNCFVQNPVCMPSRISFLSGQYPSTLGIPHMAVPVPEDTVTLPVVLGRAGYHCANIGKLHFLPHSNREHSDPHPAYGFDHMQISDEPGCYEDAYRSWVRQKAPEELDHISLGLPPARADWNRVMNLEDSVKHPEDRMPMEAVTFPGRDDVTHSAFVGENVCEYLENAPTNPFFCIAGFYSPHSPWVVPQRYLDLYDPEQLSVETYPEGWKSEHDAFRSKSVMQSIQQGYYAMVSEVDDYVGRILNTLEASGKADNTIIVFTSDHGEWLGTRCRYGKSYPGDDAVTKVPLLIRFPEGMNIEPGRRTELVEALDVLPTLLESAGVPIPTTAQGRSLLGLIRNESEGRTSALTEGAGWKSLRTKQYRFLVHDDGREMLYDMEQDPGCYYDISAKVDCSVIAGLRAELLTRVIRQEQPIPRTWPY